MAHPVLCLAAEIEGDQLVPSVMDVCGFGCASTRIWTERISLFHTGPEHPPAQNRFQLLTT